MIDDIVGVFIIIFFTATIAFMLNEVVNKAYEELYYYKNINAGKEEIEKLIEGRSKAVLLYIKNRGLSNEYNNISLGEGIGYYILIDGKEVELK